MTWKSQNIIDYIAQKVFSLEKNVGLSTHNGPAWMTGCKMDVTASQMSRQQDVKMDYLPHLTAPQVHFAL